MEACNGPLYSDGLVDIRRDSITFKGYYFPRGSKTLPLEQVAGILWWKPRWWSGKYRYWGSGDFRTWCPKDLKRHKRDRMFFLTKKGCWTRIAFTAEDSAAVISVLEKLGIPVTEAPVRGRATPSR